jgi:hypothetical protein
MYSWVVLLLAAINLGVCLSGFLAWQRSRSTLLLFNVVTLATVALNMLITGIGHWLGVGPHLRDLYGLPMLVATLALPLTLFTFATISRNSGFAWARIDWGHGAVCLFAVALLIYSLPDILTLKLVAPACWHDLVWYQRDRVTSLRCAGAPSADHVAAPLPLALWAVLMAYLGLGVGLWWREGWPLLLAGMGPGVALLLLPREWGPMARFTGETLCFCAIVVVAARNAQRHPRAAAPQETTPDPAP